MASPIQAVIFDYGNVIARFDVAMYLGAILPYSSMSPTELMLAMKQSSELIRQYETGSIPSDTFFQEVVARCRLNITKDQFIRSYVDIFEPITETHDLIRTLHGSYRLGLLSNTSEWHYQYEIRQSPVFPLFESVTVSHEAGARKPSPVIYRDALSKLGLGPEACVYIDDIGEFTDAATALGMHGVRFTTHENLLRSLEQAGVRTFVS